ncbi:uncharacterized protein KY384_004152 [Bacidia gigantensis]|uniref:uncharacterized protein n=1 Tax=Bacidia gigantensis TaxID=2732470 RepID=UPI001D0406D2|nr:uncharacterized protein KY384_004152 [Bacidia gigantensis]KAG8530795.1 hypothetical protein KY384_004152 [Bacidia gigantensis]
MATKRKLDNFFTPIDSKKARTSYNDAPAPSPPPIGPNASKHRSYPFPVPHLPEDIMSALGSVPESHSTVINDQLDLDLLYFQPFIPKSIEHGLFEFLRKELFFYRVKYKIKRGGFETDINTPRFTTVFGVDSSARWTEEGDLMDSQTSKPVPKDRWKCTPRPLPQCLDHLRQLTEIFTGATYNFCLVNYYANGADSISYHRDDERFLGPDPSIASFSLGATRDFCLKHKPIPPKDGEPPPEQNLKPPLKLPLASGDMVLMRGKTQSCWLHSLPKRKGKGSEGGRINITFRQGVKPYATENYMQYNVGDGCVYKWDPRKRQMNEWHGQVNHA